MSDSQYISEAGVEPATHTSLQPLSGAASSTMLGEDDHKSIADFVEDEPPAFKATARFWALMASLMAATFLSALDLSCISIALPTIAKELPGGANSYLWVGSAYALTSTALIPWTGSLASIYGRKPILISSILLFAVGSTICGAAKTMAVLIAGRAVAGIGGGGILVLTQIVVIDTIPLASRGPYFGLIGGVWALATTVGPPLSGALTGAGQWRWLFWLNLPFAAFAIFLVMMFMQVKAPNFTFKEKMALMDWYNTIFVVAATSMVLALSWAGTTYTWTSVQVLLPLILGLAGIFVFFFVENYCYLKNPTVPYAILAHPTSVIGFAENFLQAAVLIVMVYYRSPVFFQGARGDSVVRSGVNVLPMSFMVAPFAILCGVIVAKTGKYKHTNVVGWCLIMIGCGLLSLAKPTTSTAAWVIYPMIASMGIGLLQSGTTFPILAPLKPELQPQAVSFSMFVRSFGQVMGIAVGGTILQNDLTKRLPSEFVARFPPGQQLAFASIPILKTLPEPLLIQVRLAFAHALSMIFYCLVGVGGLGFILSLFIKDIKLTNATDKQWGLTELEEKVTAGDEEAVAGKQAKPTMVARQQPPPPPPSHQIMVQTVVEKGDL